MKRSVIAIALLAALLAPACEKLILGSEGKTTPLPRMYGSKLATVLDSIRYASDFPALAGAIVTDTGIIAAQVVGCRRYGGAWNATLNDKFHLGSNGKAFTAVLIGILVDEGKLDWNTTLPTIFPEHANSMRSEYRSVTVRDLLSHSAGFMRDPHLTLHTSSPKEQRSEVVAWALGQAPAIQRGYYLYSNLGYIIAGAVAEKLTNRSFEELVLERVLRPLGITTAGFGPMGTPGLEDQPLQHTNSHAPVEPTPDADNDPIYSPAGRFHMSISDWARYIQWVLAAEAGHQNLVSAQTAAVLTSSLVPAGGGAYYGCGWLIIDRTWAGGRSLVHSGSNGLNYSTAWLAPLRRFAVIAVTNQGPGTSANPIDPVIGRLIDFHLNGR